MFFASNLNNLLFFRKSLFLFSFPCFYFHFFFSLFFLLMSCQRDLMAEDKTRHQEKWAKAVVGLATKIWKGKSLVGVIWAWLKVWVDGLESTKQNASVFLFRQGLEAMVCFLWLSDTDSPRDIRLWRLVIISLSFSLSFFFLFMFTLFTRDVAKGWRKDWATWGGEAEPRGSDGLCRRSKEDRAGKTNICGKVMTWKSKQAKWQSHRRSRQLRRAHEGPPWKAQACVQQGLGEEPIQRYSKKEFAKSLGRGGCTLALFWNGTRFTEKGWRVD